MACQLALRRGEHPTPRRGALYDEVNSCFFRPAGRFRDGLARPISALLASPDGESTGDPSVASLALALAPWLARCALKVEKVESVLPVARSAPRGRAGDVKSALRGSHPRKQKVQSIPYIYPMRSDLLCDSSINTPHVDLTRDSHPSMCTHHAAAEHAAWLPVRDDSRCSSCLLYTSPSPRD